MGTMNLKIQRLGNNRIHIDIGYSTGVRIVPTALLDAYYPGGIKEYVDESKTQGRTPIIVEPLLFKPLGPYDSEEFKLMKHGFVPEQDFTWITAKPSRWFLEGPKYSLSSKTCEIVFEPENIAPSDILQASSPIGTAKWMQAKRAVIQPLESIMNNSASMPWAVVDASILYGTARILKGLHHNPSWSYRDKYRREDDYALFLEFLHALLLYEKIILDNSSVDDIGEEIEELIRIVNGNSGYMTIEPRKIGDENKAQSVAYGVCRLINKLRTKHRLLQIQVPWAYYQNSHYNYSIFHENISQELRPLATFAFRGLCYAAYARAISRNTSNPTLYLAAAGRLAVLEPLLDGRDMKHFDFPKREYADLIEILDLPSAGFDFDYLSSSFAGYEISSLAQHISTMSPEQALLLVLNLRNSPQVHHLRSDWHERILQHSRSIAIGPAVSQNVQNCTIGGNLNMYICARPLEE